MVIILFFLTLMALADEDRTTWDKSLIRDRNICYLDGKRLVVAVKSLNHTYDSNEMGFGEYAFYSTSDEDEETPVFKLLPLKKDGFDIYRFFYANNSICSKQLAYRLNSRIFALLFLKDNNPSHNKLVIQLFDIKTMKPKDPIDTTYMTNTTISVPGGFAFKSLTDRDDHENSYIKINNVKYNYCSQDFSPWIYFTINGFKTSGTLSYQNFKWKHLFKDKRDFHKFTGWDDRTKIFNTPFLYHATNHETRKECVLFTTSRRKLTDKENWKCAQLM